MAYLNINIIQGESYSLSFRAKDGCGEYINLSGYNAVGVVKEKYSSTTGIANFTSTIPYPESGYVNITLSPAQTRSLSPNVYLYDIIVYTESTGIEIGLLNGHLTLSPGISF